jgi:hypothetical protein
MIGFSGPDNPPSYVKRRIAIRKFDLKINSVIDKYTRPCYDFCPFGTDITQKDINPKIFSRIFESNRKPSHETVEYTAIINLDNHSNPFSVAVLSAFGGTSLTLSVALQVKRLIFRGYFLSSQPTTVTNLFATGTVVLFNANTTLLIQAPLEMRLKFGCDIGKRHPHTIRI